MKRGIASLTAFLMALLFCVSLAGEAYAEGQAPVAQNLELKTYRNTSVGGRLSAYDPDRDVVSFEITTKPVKGDLKLMEDGSFIYTPRRNKKGRDYFGYRAKDAEGHVSQEATAQIRIEQRSKAMRYQDTEGRAGDYAAAVLMERGIFIGEQLGGKLYFSPDRPVTRGEFLRMAMQIAGTPLMRTVMLSPFEDDAAMDEGTRAVAATAANAGLVETGGRFEAEEGIGLAEAARILSAALKLEDAAVPDGEHDLQACFNLMAAGILDEAAREEELLTREQAAILLVRAAETIAGR